MPTHPTTSVFFFYVLGKLHEAHATAIDRHLLSCRRCRDLCSAVENDVADLGLALEPAPVPAWMRESLLHSAREVHRLSDAVPTLRRALRCSVRRAAEILAKVDAPRHWKQVGEAWTMLLPQREPRRAALVRLSLSARYTVPRGQETMVHVLQGHARSSIGGLRAGRFVKVPSKSRFAAYPGPDVLLLFTWNRLPRPEPQRLVVRRQGSKTSISARSGDRVAGKDIGVGEG